MQTHQAGNVGIVMLKRIYVALGGFLDEFPIRHLPAIVLARKPLRANLQALREPPGKNAGKPAHSRARQGRQSGDNGSVRP